MENLVSPAKGFLISGCLACCEGGGYRSGIPVLLREAIAVIRNLLAQTLILWRDVVEPFLKTTSREHHKQE
ncbi:hypothetical protein CEXT_715151 [Caerostris extrusa]|uniref:Uncharacterized protein n=1 Tax=Caerostris extrusa TaxID=172846 RepID=A0AAV4X3R6_CAEEX|nr:hypothetical protein CEXT_715151 [Caerostris extrusa]